MKALVSFVVAALVSMMVVSADAAPADVPVETQRLIRALERQFHVEGRGYFKAETDLNRWMMTSRDAANLAREARWNAGFPVAPLRRINAMIARHCQILSPGCVAAVVVLTSR